MNKGWATDLSVSLGTWPIGDEQKSQEETDQNDQSKWCYMIYEKKPKAEQIQCFLTKQLAYLWLTDLFSVESIGLSLYVCA